jgi:hypothetical protein
MDEIKQKLAAEIHNILSETPNEDETIDALQDAMDYFCSTWDKCEGYKHAINETLTDQIENHIGDVTTDELYKLMGLITGSDGLVCTFSGCFNLQTADGEFCGKHYPIKN